jgi:GntR family transcriptional regulator
MAEFGVARGTVRDAMSLLRSEGMAVTQHGRGTFARSTPPVRRVAAVRYRRDRDQILAGQPPATSFTHDQGIAWSDYTLDKEFSEVPASSAIAELFGVEPGTMLLERRFVFRSMGVAQQMSTSMLLLDMVAGTPVADPAHEPWPGGNISQLYSLGVEVTAVVERVRARMPMRDETEALKLPGGVPVLSVVRQMYAGDRVVEVADSIVMPGDRVELEFRTEL